MALPIALCGVLIIAGIHFAFGSVSAALVTNMPIQTALIRTDFSLRSRVRLTLEQGARYRLDDAGEVDVLSGTATVDTHGITVFRHGCVVSSVIGGAAMFIVSESSVSIAPLSSVVLVDACGVSTSLLVPGVQSVVREDGDSRTMSVPDQWLTQYAVDHPLLPADHVLSTLHDPSADVPPLFAPLIDALSADVQRDLSETQTDALAALTLRMIGHLRPLDDQYQMRLSSFLLASTAFRSSLPTLLPASISASPRALPSSLLSAWIDAVLQLSFSEPAEAKAVLASGLHVSELLSNFGLPLQSAAWRDAVRVVRSALKPRSDFESSSSSSLSTAPQSALRCTGEGVSIGVARDMLIDAGLLLTIKTDIRISSIPGCIDVHSVAVSDDGETHLYDFILDPVQRHVFSLVRDGKPAPNTLPLDALARS